MPLAGASRVKSTPGQPRVAQATGLALTEGDDGPRGSVAGGGLTFLSTAGMRTGIPGRGCARAVLGPWRVESRRAPAEGGGAVARESGTPSGSGRDADCCGSSGKAAGYVTRGSLPHQRSLGP